MAEKINPWKITRPVQLHAAVHAKRFNHLVFTGTMADLRQFAKKHQLKAVVYTDFWLQQVHVTNWQTVGIGPVWAACNETNVGRTRQVACVAVDKNNLPKDPAIWLPTSLTTSVNP
jgi:hypothetical protein